VHGEHVGDQMSSILVVDDEARLRTFLNRSLVAEGHQVAEAADGQTAIDFLAAMRPDLVMLDLVMPGMNGLEVLDAVQRLPHPPPVIVLSGVGDVAARVAALERGAVDFVAKPFHLSELLARTRRHLRNGPPQGSVGRPRFLECGAVRLDLDRRRVRLQDGETALPEREFTLLAHLMRRTGEVCRKDELLHDVWGLDFDPGSNVVEVAVRRLRSKLRALPIETVRGVGYCYVAEAS
jgi:DNA-binding response OmpR family regulator